jgi:predicted membrane-bound spermidine synthase
VVQALRGPGLRLVLTSATLLFVELVLLRWVPANVTYIGFFSNFLLMASFLGIGVGILLGRRFANVAWSPFPGLLLAVVGLILGAKLDVQIRASNEIFFGLAESRAADTNFLVLPLVFVLVAAVMAALALPLGALFRSMPPLRAYALDIGGSIGGIALFTGLSVLSSQPPVWFGVIALLLAGLALARPLTRFSLINAAFVVATCALVIGATASGDLWSPYYRITVQRPAGSDTTISVNGIPHQAMHAVETGRTTEPFYDQIYQWFPGRRFAHALVIGAGSGTDTAYALANKVQAIDAVEIDPRILELGEREHPDHPYSDPRVREYVDDGRAFLRSSQDRYDLIVFALPDSLTLVSTSANVRLESFLFTREAFVSARDHLTPNGVFVLYNYYRQPWLLAKIEGMLADVFQTDPLVRQYDAPIGSAAVLAASPTDLPVSGQASLLDPASPSERPAAATDDWPFLYLRDRVIAPYYILALAFVLLVAGVATVLAARVVSAPIAAFSPHFFLLGAAFLLLETRSLTIFSLLFGTTWTVNAMAFAAILVSVLLAIGVNAVTKPPRVILYSGLGVTLLLTYVLTPSALLFDPAWLRYLAAAVIAFAPVFFANLVFTASFRDTTTADMAFASNLIGAMIGGVLEYAALLTGYQALLLIVAALYAAAYLAGSRVRLFADRRLVTAEPA